MTAESLVILARIIAAPTLATLLAWVIARRVLAPQRAAVIAALAGGMAGWAANAGQQAAFPPAQALDWLPILLLAVTAIASLHRALGRWSSLARVLILVAGVHLLAPPALREQPVAVLAIEVGVVLVAGVGLATIFGRTRGEGREAVALAIAFAALGLVTAVGGSIVIGSVALAIAVTLGWLWLGQLTSRVRALGSGAAAAGALAWVWLAFMARHLAEIAWPELALASLAAVAVVLSPASGEGWRRALSRLLVPAVPAIAAVVLAGWRLASSGPMY